MRRLVVNSRKQTLDRARHLLTTRRSRSVLC